MRDIATSEYGIYMLFDCTHDYHLRFFSSSECARSGLVAKFSKSFLSNDRMQDAIDAHHAKVLRVIENNLQSSHDK